MKIRPQNVVCATLVALLFLQAPFSAAQATTQPGAVGNAVIWTDPGDVRSKDLFWGAGDEKHQPQLPVVFEEEDRHGTYPKFDVRDANGAQIIADASADSLLGVLHRGRCYATEITRDSLTALRLEAHFDDRH